MTENTIEQSLNTLIDNDIEKIQQTILLVDDEDNNLQLLKRTLRGAYNIKTAHNGLEALDLIDKEGEDISLIVSDQKMPEMEGTEFLKKVNEKNPDIVKILLTGHQDTEIIVSAINECQLYQYILKPFEPEELKVSIQNGLKKYELSSSKNVILKDLKELFYKTIKSIAFALDAKDPYTHGHSLRVTLYSLILANELGLDNDTLEEIETAGLLHDIGKIAIPQNILCKAGKLTDEEFEIMKQHPAQGEKMIRNIKKLKSVASWLKSHHEKWNGTGYPNRLKGEEIPITARIIAIADTYDAMTSTRSYRVALPHEVAIQEVQKCAGTQFDPKLAELFVKLSDKVKAAQQNPEEYYNQYSYLQKYIDSVIT